MKHVFSVILLAVLSWGGYAYTQPNISFLDTLPSCSFSDAAPSNEIIVGAVVYNLQTGAGCAENLDEVFPVASVPKIFVAAALFEWVLENDAISFDTELTFSERYWMGGRGDCLNSATLNQRVTIGYLGNVMISCSDNAATWMLMDAMGWDRVNNYVERLNINGIGEVIPYSEVDRQKLIYLDDTWNNVPTAMASRFYRSEMTTGLNTYFDPAPIYTHDDEIRANALYFENGDFNTLTPRATAEYLLKLTADSPRNDNTGQIARWVFNTMLLTDRQFTAQSLPGTISVGAKNGWDYGLRAEVNVLFDTLPANQRNPIAFTIIYTRQTDFDSPNLQPPTPSNRGVLNQYLVTLAPVINRILFPAYTPRDLVRSRQLASYAVNPKLIMDGCWNPYANNGYRFDNRGALESCWLNQPRSRIAPGDNIGIGLILDNLDQEFTRLTFIYTDPDGIPRSYQMNIFDVDNTAVYYWHPIPQGQTGTWQVEVFINRNPIIREQVEVTNLF